MKKFMSYLVSAMLVASMLVPFSAMAADKGVVSNEEIAAQVNADIQGAVEYLNITPSIDDLYGAYNLFKVDTTKAHGMLTQFDISLAINNGKIVSAGVESAMGYAAAINILKATGNDPANYKGYDIVSEFKNIADKSVENPYHYRAITEACKAVGEDEYAKSFIDDFITNYYTMGEGVDYWGYSCDNTCMFVAAAAPYANDYQEYIDDAIAVIKSYERETGFLYDNAPYSTEPNADSTAAAIMAFSAVGDYDKAYDVYNKLMKNFESADHNGVMMGVDYLTGDFTENAYATNDALIAYGYFDATRIVHTFEGDTCKVCGMKKAQEPAIAPVPQKDTAVKSPQTGATILGVSAVALGALAIAVSRKEN